jgi:hypothetical protein
VRGIWLGRLILLLIDMLKRNFDWAMFSESSLVIFSVALALPAAYNLHRHFSDAPTPIAQSQPATDEKAPQTITQAPRTDLLPAKGLSQLVEAEIQ